MRKSNWYPEYDSPLRSLRPHWRAFLSILCDVSLWSKACLSVTTSGIKNSFSATHYNFGWRVTSSLKYPPPIDSIRSTMATN
jgi:hypothetical protein